MDFISFEIFRDSTRFLRLLVLSLLLFILSPMLTAQYAQAATLTVDTLTDESDGSCADGDCSLRDAITTGTSGDTIDFSVTGVITLSLGELIVGKNLTITGPGTGQLSIDANKQNRVFRIDAGTVKVFDLTITRGVSTAEGGGVLIAFGASLALDRVEITENMSTGAGGGIAVFGTLTLNRSTVSGNDTSDGGGGIYAGLKGTSNGNATIDNSTISGNTAQKLGGGFFNNNGTSSISFSTISGNTGSAGGALASFGGEVHLRTTILADTPGGVGDCFDFDAVSSSPSILTGGWNLIESQSAASCVWNSILDLEGVDPKLAALADNGGPTLTQALQAGSPAIDWVPTGMTGCQAGFSKDQRGAVRAGGPGQGGSKCEIGAYEFDSPIVLPGEIVIVKKASGGNRNFNFSLTSTAKHQAFSLTTVNGTATETATELPGTYDLLEIVPPGWELTLSSCDNGDDPNSINLGPGQTITCTFENAKHGTITIKKNAPGGGTGFNFNQSIDNSGNFTLDNAGSKVFSDVPLGTYTVTELNPTAGGYELSGLTCVDSSNNSSVDIPARTATIQLDAGDAVTCTYTNAEEDTVVVEKLTIPAGAGGSFGFSQTLDGSGNFNLGGGQSKIFTNVSSGVTHIITEADPNPGFDLTGIDCHDTATGQSFPGDLATRTATLDLTAGERIHCTFINTQRGTVIIRKATLPAGGTGFGFTGDLGNFNLNDGGTQTFNDVIPGSYNVTENNPSASGFELSKLICTDSSTAGSNSIWDLPSRTATVNLDPGETVTCTYTNTEEDTIVIEKITVPAGIGGNFTFTQSIDASGNFMLSDGQSKPFNSVAPGNYTITEQNPAPDFDLTGIDCHDTDTGQSFPGDLTTGTATLNLTAGEIVHCIYENTQSAPLQPSFQLFPGSVDFGSQPVGTTSSPKTSTIANSGTVDFIISNIASENPAEFIVGPDNCSGKTLKPGETCTFSLQFKPAQTGQRSSQVNIISNAGTTPYAISGTGGLPGSSGSVKPIPTLSFWTQMLLMLMLALIGGYGISARRLN